MTFFSSVREHSPKCAAQVGLLCIPFSLILSLILAVLPLVSLVYGVVAAIETSQGKDFRYLWVGDWVRGTLEQ